MRGQRVCRMHGGSSPQAKLKADQRLALMVDPVLSEMFRIALDGESDGVRLAAGRDLLDRAGLKPAVQLQTDQEITIRVVTEDQPITVVEHHYELNGHSN